MIAYNRRSPLVKYSLWLIDKIFWLLLGFEVDKWICELPEWAHYLVR